MGHCGATGACATVRIWTSRSESSPLMNLYQLCASSVMLNRVVACIMQGAPVFRTFIRRSSSCSLSSSVENVSSQTKWKYMASSPIRLNVGPAPALYCFRSLQSVCVSFLAKLRSFEEINCLLLPSLSSSVCRVFGQIKLSLNLYFRRLKCYRKISLFS